MQLARVAAHAAIQGQQMCVMDMPFRVTDNQKVPCDPGFGTAPWRAAECQCHIQEMGNSLADLEASFCQHLLQKTSKFIIKLDSLMSQMRRADRVPFVFVTMS